VFEIRHCPHCGAERQEWARICGKCRNAYAARPAPDQPAPPAGAEPAPSPEATTPAWRTVRFNLPRLATPPSTRLRLLGAWLAVEFGGAAVLLAIGDSAMPALLWLVAGCCACQAAIILGV